METILTLQDISKTFGGIKALSDARFELAAGEIHALVGANGAGKSTLIKILTGALRGDGGCGEIKLFGAAVDIDNPARARALGISAVYQEFSLIKTLSVAENIYLGRLPKKGPVVDKKALVARAKKYLDLIEADIDPKMPVAALSVAHKQLVEIAKALSNDSKILILDEPTASLSSDEVTQLFKILRRLRDQGIGIIYVSHRLEELPDLVDRITVFRDGRYIVTLPIAEAPKPTIIRHMVGRDVATTRRPARIGQGELLRVEDFSGPSGFSGVNFSLRSGEILGFAGLAGAGRTETVRALFGVDPVTGGTVYIDGKKATIRNPRTAKAHGLAFITEDRKDEGLVLPLSIVDNLAITVLRGLSRLGIIDGRKYASNSVSFIDRMGIKCAGAAQKVRALSGGNQQKVVIGKWLATEPSILIMDEPTRGIDVGSKSQIYEIIHALADGGKGVILISSEIPEILELSDRIIVFAGGKPTAELDPMTTSQDEILHYATSLGSCADL